MVRNSTKATKRRKMSKPEKNNFQDRFAEREYHKGEESGEKFSRAYVKTGKDNDPQWYFKDKRILDDVASFSFATPLGSRLRYSNYRVPSSTIANSLGTASVPGLMSMVISPTPGVSIDAQSPINIAAVNLYSFVRYKNSGAANYDAPDMMLYMIAMDSVYAAWNWMKRIYGFVSSYSQQNLYMPKAYALANGVDIDDIAANLADFRAWLNVKANEISSFCVPATMTYMVRHSWLYSNVYQDSNTAKAQQYMYVPGWFYQYDETTSPDGGKLTPVNCLALYSPDTATSMPWNFATLKSLLNGMLEALNYSEDIGIMSGDILKAYGSNLFTLGGVDADYKVTPIYSEEVLTQIENSQPLDIITTQGGIDEFSITQDPDTNYIICNPVLSGNSPRVGGFLNFHWSNPTPEQVIVATRLKTSTVVSGTDEAPTITITSMGSEFASAAFMFINAPTGTWNTPVQYTQPYSIRAIRVPFTSFPVISGATTSQVMATYLAAVAMIISFDWGPAMLIGYNMNGVFNCVGDTRDWDVYVQLDNQDIEALNLLALLTEFNVPN